MPTGSAHVARGTPPGILSVYGVRNLFFPFLARSSPSVRSWRFAFGEHLGENSCIMLHGSLHIMRDAFEGKDKRRHSIRFAACCACEIRDRGCED
jgi:hypothetical protein